MILRGNLIYTVSEGGKGEKGRTRHPLIIGWRGEKAKEKNIGSTRQHLRSESHKI